MQRFRCGLVFKAHRLLYHSTLHLRVIKKMKKTATPPPANTLPAEVRAGEVTQDKMLRCHLPRVAYHQVYNVY